MICGFFVGMVLSLQAINALEQFGASDQVSLLVVKSLFRELGPVLTALLFRRPRRHFGHCRDRADEGHQPDRSNGIDGD